MRVMLLCLLLSLSLSIIAGPARADGLDDAFDGTAVDPGKWWVDGDSVVEADGVLTMTLPAASTEVAAALTATWLLRGAFDYQVDYELVEWPADRYAGVGLLAALQSSTWTNWSVQRASIQVATSFQQVYLADYVPPPGDTDFTYGVTQTADTAGTLRLARDENSTLTVSVKHPGASDWVVIYSGSMPPGDVRPILMGWTDGAVPATVAFDNFQVNLGEVAVPGTFWDLPVDYWAYPEVSAVMHAGIVTGYPDGGYHPEDPVTRDQMAVYVSRAVAGSDEAVPTGPGVATFADVPTDHWAFRYVEYAKDLGIVAGYSPTTYAPAVPVDRGQMAVFIARAIASPIGEGGLSDYTPPSTASFPDVPTDFWAYKYIEYIRNKDITGGYPDGRYHPEVIVTRDQMAVYVQRAFRLPL